MIAWSIKDKWVQVGYSSVAECLPSWGMPWATSQHMTESKTSRMWEREDAGEEGGREGQMEVESKEGDRQEMSGRGVLKTVR